MTKTIVLCVFVVLLFVWAVWDQFAHWECILFGDCRDHWFGVSCSRCGHTENVHDIKKLPDRCPKCGRRMR